MCAPKQAHSHVTPKLPVTATYESKPMLSYLIAFGISTASFISIVIFLFKCCVKNTFKFKKKNLSSIKTVLLTSAETFSVFEIVKKLDSLGTLCFILCNNKTEGIKLRMNLKQMGCEPRRQILKYVDCTNAEDIQKFTEQFCYEVDFLDAIVDVPSTSGSNYFGDTAKNEDFGNVKLIEGLLQSSCTSKESRLYVSMYPPLDSELKYLRCLEDHLKKTGLYGKVKINSCKIEKLSKSVLGSFGHSSFLSLGGVFDEILGFFSNIITVIFFIFMSSA